MGRRTRYIQEERPALVLADESHRLFGIPLSEGAMVNGTFEDFPNIPLRTGSLPVGNAARLGEQTG